MGIKFVKTIHSKEFQEIIIKDYQKLKSIRQTAKIHGITTRQIVSILNDNLIDHSKKRIIYLDEHFFDHYDDDIIGPEVMYWAGFIAADGNVMNTPKTRNYTLTVRLAVKDIDHLYKLQSSLKSNANIKKHLNKGGFRAGKQFKDSECCVIVFNSKHLVNSLSKWNIVPNKSKIYKFPESFIEHKFINSFIRGYCDGDGSISYKEKPRISFYGTKDCLETIMKIIYNNCNLSLKNVNKNRTIYCLEYARKKDVPVLLKWLYGNAQIYLNRKYELSQLILNNIN